MTLAEAKYAGGAMCPVRYDKIIYTRVKKIEYDCLTREIHLQLYDRDSHSITVAPLADVEMSSPDELARQKENRQKTHDALDDLIANCGEGTKK